MATLPGVTAQRIAVASNRSMIAPVVLHPPNVTFVLLASIYADSAKGQ
jgi:hypothetical protein